MRAVYVTRHGSPDVLAVREGPEPQPGPGQVKVRVRAAGLNFAEVMGRLGLYPDAPRPPCVLGYEGAGVVEALGSGVEGPAVGTPVVFTSRFGAQAEAVCVTGGQVFPLPEGMSFEAGAALPVNYLTAYHALFRVAALRPGERVLVHMAAGGVGLAALQLCRTVAGVEVFGTASPGKHAALREAGCAHPVDYRSRDYAAEVRRLTGGEGVDVVLDPLGGADWRKGYRLLRPAGRLVAYGFANLAGGERRSVVRAVSQLARVPRFNPIALMNDNRAVAGVNMGHLWSAEALLGEELRALLALQRQGAIAPRIDRVFPFAEAAAAHRRLQSRQNVGKVILVP